MYGQKADKDSQKLCEETRSKLTQLVEQMERSTAENSHTETKRHTL